MKTLSDPRSDQVNFKPHDISIRRLRKKPDPHATPSTPRLDGVEETTYRIKARLIAFQRENDHDIHLAVSVPGAKSKTMRVELPDTRCPGARGSVKKAQMARARSALIKACGTAPKAPRAPADLKGTATITGVGFFDVKHKQPQTEAAANKIELHPVLRVSKLRCSR